jgi:SAM-dependent methyltransferase
MDMTLFHYILLLEAFLSTTAFVTELPGRKKTWGSSSSSSEKRGVVLKCSKTTTTTIIIPDDPENSTFGRQDYWNQVYEKQSNFSWYAGWEELQPFVDEFLGDHQKKDARVLIPGVGNDATLVDMYDDGYLYLTAMDYAPEGIERSREMLGESRIRKDMDDGSTSSTSTGVDLVVADARDLREVFDDHVFDAVIEKGTLHTIFLSGGQDKGKAVENLNMAISELGRCIKPGGIWISIAAVVVDQIQASFDARDDDWDCLVEKESLYVTEDGYTSNNIEDGTLLVWRKRR